MEIGWIPIQHNIRTHAIKYWSRLAQGTQNSIIDESYKDSLEQKTPWIQGIQHFLITRGLSNIWNKPTNYNCDNIVTQIKQKLSDEFNQIVQRESSKSQTLKDYLVIAERDNGKHPS